MSEKISRFFLLAMPGLAIDNGCLNSSSSLFSQVFRIPPEDSKKSLRQFLTATKSEFRIVGNTLQITGPESIYKYPVWSDGVNQDYLATFSDYVHKSRENDAVVENVTFAHVRNQPVKVNGKIVPFRHRFEFDLVKKHPRERDCRFLIALVLTDEKRKQFFGCQPGITPPYRVPRFSATGKVHIVDDYFLYPGMKLAYAIGCLFY